jgi:hypothetical protein
MCFMCSSLSWSNGVLLGCVLVASQSPGRATSASDRCGSAPRRQAVRPQQVGLPDAGRRRTPGLRRGEPAVLAGISTGYYVRLEQGRERSPSAQVLGARWA